MPADLILFPSTIAQLYLVSRVQYIWAAYTDVQLIKCELTRNLITIIYDFFVRLSYHKWVINKVLSSVNQLCALALMVRKHPSG